jgi:hypothetical protein
MRVLYSVENSVIPDGILCRGSSSAVEAFMDPRSVLRLIGLQALLIAVTIQGLTPHTFTILSPWVLGRLDPSATTGRPDARYGGIPENDRPAPLNGNDRDEAPGEVVIPSAFRAESILGRRVAFRSGGTARTDDRHETHILPRRFHPASPAADPISSHCRLTC